MDTKVITSQEDVYYALATLISKNPFEQAKWLEEVIENPLSINQFDWCTPIKGYETTCVETGLFLIVFVEENKRKKHIVDVVSFETLDEVQDYFINRFCFDCEYHLFCYKKREGYIEVPCNIGWYTPFKDSVCNYVKENSNLPVPCKTYYFGKDIVKHTSEGRDICDDSDIDENDDDFLFFEVPNLYEIDYEFVAQDKRNDMKVCPYWGYRKKYFIFKDFDNALKFAIEELILYYLDSKDKIYRTECDRVILSDRWYKHYIYVDEDMLEEKVTKAGGSFNALPFEFIESCVKVVSSIKFAEQEGV